ncbi:hypothetical protein CCACVL1_15105 [Corchorus capsularis]|uniref:Uncharacterized protein n=1 Tax=Corchorus capsularis TaxID=210143 RepID=A0A1R3I411_COCAP|nr:hypothetical protein CCACVL1_15105 [Corchorus capsularis]
MQLTVCNNRHHLGVQHNTRTNLYGGRKLKPLSPSRHATPPFKGIYVIA